METDIKDLNTIEAALLNRELKLVERSLARIGQELLDLFGKYGRMEGEHKVELQAYIQEHALSAHEHYFSGTTTTPSTNSNPKHVPDCIKGLILKWAVDDFFEKFDEIESVVTEGGE